jgi:hypothetical protein
MLLTDLSAVTTAYDNVKTEFGTTNGDSMQLVVFFVFNELQITLWFWFPAVCSLL